MQSTIFKQKSNYWRVFALCFFTAVLLFAPHCIVDAVAGGGYFHYAGDFNDQQINFYQYANAFVKNGGSFSWATDLGSGFVNSYSFYLLGSPFFWLSMVVPARLMPWAMVPLLCLKMLQDRLRNNPGTMQGRVLCCIMELLSHLDSSVSEILTSQLTHDKQLVASCLSGFLHLFFCHFQYIMVIGSGQSLIRGDYYQSRSLLPSRFVLPFIEIFIIDLR